MNAKITEFNTVCMQGMKISNFHTNKINTIILLFKTLYFMLAYHGNKITFALLVYINFSLLGPVIIIEKKITWRIQL